LGSSVRLDATPAAPAFYVDPAPYRIGEVRMLGVVRKAFYTPLAWVLLYVCGGWSTAGHPRASKTAIGSR
jgi:hypothetical protein